MYGLDSRWLATWCPTDWQNEMIRVMRVSMRATGVYTAAVADAATDASLVEVGGVIRPSIHYGSDGITLLRADSLICSHCGHYYCRRRYLYPAGRHNHAVGRCQQHAAGNASHIASTQPPPSSPHQCSLVQYGW